MAIDNVNFQEAKNIHANNQKKTRNENFLRERREYGEKRTMRRRIIGRGYGWGGGGNNVDNVFFSTLSEKEPIGRERIGKQAQTYASITK